MTNKYNEIKNDISFFKSLKKTIFFEYKAMKENKSSLFTSVVYPIVYYIFIIKGLSVTIGKVSYLGTDIDYTLYGLTGLIGIICIGEINNVLYRTIIDNKWGLLHLKVLNGIRIIPYCLGKSFYSFVGVNIQIPILLSLYFLTGSRIGLLNLIYGYISIIIILLFWSNLGILIALKITSYKVRDMITGVGLLPLYFSAPTYYILDVAPKYIKIIAYVNPLTYQLNGLREAMIFLKLGNSFLIMLSFTVVIILINLIILRNIKYNRTQK